MIRGMFPSRLFLCCLLQGSASLVCGQTLVRLAASNEPPPTDHTGEIISFTAIGTGAGAASGLPRLPRPWTCYNTNISNVVWQFPDGTAVPAGVEPVTGDQLITRINAPRILARGPTYNSPDGEHCCVRTTNNERRCVTFTPCPTLSPVSNGMISYDPATNVATFTCVPGYAVTGSSSITCNEDTMQWSSTERPTCEVSTITCTDLTAPANGMIGYNAETMNTRPVNTMATHSCVTGYQLSSSTTTRTCQSDRIWSGSSLICELICRNLIVPTNGAVLYSDPTIPRAEGSTGSYSCVTGYTRGGTLTRTCTVSGWTASVDGTPTCTVVDCGSLSATNGGVMTTGTIYQSTATYTCNPGYTRSEDQLRTCQANGQWSGSAPVCNPVDCGPLTIDNGTVDTSSGTTFMMTATYTCNPGYNIVGSDTQTCEATALWTPEAPTCTPVECGSLTVPNGQVSAPSGTTFMSTVTYTCDDGYTLNGGNIRTCQANGMWSGRDPTCDRPRCPVGTYMEDLSTGESACVPCPGNSFSTVVDSRECSCFRGYYRTEMEEPNFMCSSPPNNCKSLQAVAERTRGNTITVRWGRPEISGRDDFYYNIFYSEDNQTFTQHNSRPYVKQDALVDYSVSGLQPLTTYTIRVIPENGVSGQEEVGQSRSCEVVARTGDTRSNAPSLVIGFCSVVVWTAPTRSYGRITGYDVRFIPQGSGSDLMVSKGRTELFHAFRDTGLDSTDNIMVQVRAKTSAAEGRWSELVPLGCRNAEGSAGPIYE